MVGTLQVINSTRVAASENRLALKSMTKAINGLNIVYGKAVKSIRGDTDDIYLSIKISDLTTSIVRTTQAVQYLYVELSSLSHQFALAQVGILHKNLVTRRDLQRLLRRITKKLPSNFELPYPVDKPNEYIFTILEPVLSPV